MTTAPEILRALRHKFRNDAVVHEVAITDPHQTAIYNRWKQEAYPAIYTHESFEKRGETVAPEVPEGWLPGKFQRRIDALVFNGNTSLTAIEIKVSRADFFRDTDEKRRVWREHTNRFIYAVPLGLVEPGEVADGCGLMVFDPSKFNPKNPWSHGFETLKKAKINKTPEPLPTHVLTAFAYRLSNMAKKGLDA